MNNFILDKQNSINCLKKVLQALKLYKVFRMHTFFYVRYYVKKTGELLKIIEKLSTNDSRYRPFDNFISYLRAENNNEDRFIQ